MKQTEIEAREKLVKVAPRVGAWIETGIYT